MLKALWLSNNRRAREARFKQCMFMSPTFVISGFCSQKNIHESRSRVGWTRCTQIDGLEKLQRLREGFLILSYVKPGEHNTLDLSCLQDPYRRSLETLPPS